MWRTTAGLAILVDSVDNGQTDRATTGKWRRCMLFLSHLVKAGTISVSTAQADQKGHLIRQCDAHAVSDFQSRILSHCRFHNAFEHPLGAPEVQTFTRSQAAAGTSPNASNIKT